MGNSLYADSVPLNPDDIIGQTLYFENSTG